MSCSADDPTMARRPRHPPPSYGCNRRPCPATVRNHRLHRRNPAVLMSYITILTKSMFPAATAAMPYRGRASGPAAWTRCPIRPHICAGLSARGNASPTAPHDDPSRWQDMQRIVLNDTGASMVPGQSGIKRKANLGDSGNPHHAHLCGNMSHPRTNIIENDHRTMRRTNHHHAPNHRRRA